MAFLIIICHHQRATQNPLGRTIRVGMGATFPTVAYRPARKIGSAVTTNLGKASETWVMTTAPLY